MKYKLTLEGVDAPHQVGQQADFELSNGKTAEGVIESVYLVVALPTDPDSIGGKVVLDSAWRVKPPNQGSQTPPTRIYYGRNIVSSNVI